MESTEKNFQKYAGQIADFARSNSRISFVDKLKKMTEAEGDPFIKVFSARSIYLVTLFEFAELRSVVANIPLVDLPVITRRTDFAMSKLYERSFSAQNTFEERSNEETSEIPLAFHPLKVGANAGKTPGDLLLEADNPASVKSSLQKQVSFLKSNLQKFPKNQEQIDIINDALNLFDLGILQDSKPSTGTVEKPVSNGKAFDVYRTPVKHQKAVDQATGFNKCYSIAITCSPWKNFPFHIEIMNCIAPLGQYKNGMKPVMMDKAQKVTTKSIDLTEQEWSLAVENMNSNADHLANLWFPEMYQKDMSYRNTNFH